ncbi:MAG: hypothetical protein OXE78_00240 [Gammaproteobacteria bacterium]|nr:hypothetical protein [Gammaproteobacteria bacterium]MCY4357125.1 hypothetical protein [Gammaproteobacteria bacterium]
MNRKGYVHCEHTFGSGSTDLLVSWPLWEGGEKRIVIECKVRRKGNSMERVIGEGLEQIRN